MAKQVGLLTAVLFYFFRSLLQTRKMTKQIALYPSCLKQASEIIK
jgi:hypothetical protein